MRGAERCLGPRQARGDCLKRSGTVKGWLILARPTKYSADRSAAIIASIRNGAPDYAAAEASDIDYSTFTRWKRRYAEFRNGVTRAEAECEAEHAKVLHTAGTGYNAGHVVRTTKTVFVTKEVVAPDGTITRTKVPKKEITETVHSGNEFDWRASLEILKRRFPSRWGDKIQSEHTGAGGGPISIRSIVIEHPGEVAQGLFDPALREQAIGNREQGDGPDLSEEVAEEAATASELLKDWKSKK